MNLEEQRQAAVHILGKLETLLTSRDKDARKRIEQRALGCENGSESQYADQINGSLRKSHNALDETLRYFPDWL